MCSRLMSSHECVRLMFYYLLVYRDTEERAQGAEERAIQAETELKQALERIRALERSASRVSAISTLSPGQQTPSDRPVSSRDSKRPATQTSTGHSRSPSQQSGRASTRTSSRKK
jgi:hypothetical protein